MNPQLSIEKDSGPCSSHPYHSSRTTVPLNLSTLRSTVWYLSVSPTTTTTPPLPRPEQRRVRNAALAAQSALHLHRPSCSLLIAPDSPPPGGSYWPTPRPAAPWPIEDAGRALLGRIGPCPSSPYRSRARPRAVYNTPGLSPRCVLPFTAARARPPRSTPTLPFLNGARHFFSIALAYSF